MDKKVVFTVGVLSNSAVVWTEYASKREAVAALIGSATIQKTAPRTWVVRRK